MALHKGDRVRVTTYEDLPEDIRWFAHRECFVEKFKPGPEGSILTVRPVTTFGEDDPRPDSFDIAVTLVTQPNGDPL